MTRSARPTPTYDPAVRQLVPSVLLPDGSHMPVLRPETYDAAIRAANELFRRPVEGPKVERLSNGNVHAA